MFIKDKRISAIWVKDRTTVPNAEPTDSDYPMVFVLH